MIKELCLPIQRKLEFRVPTENLLADKQMIRQQYAQAVANQQNAAYKLQKATPLIKILDKPEPPYDVENKSAVFYGLMGLFAGLNSYFTIICKRNNSKIYQGGN